MLHDDVILVTGAGGLVGSAVVDQLGSRPNVVGLTRKDVDLMNAHTVNSIFKGVRPKHVFHAAACVYGIGGNLANMGKSFYENTVINTNVIEACRLAGSVEKITVMGTGAVYPFPPPSLPLRESDIFEGRPHPSECAYAHAKRGMLAMLEAYEASYGLQWAYIVSCNLFGPRDKFDIDFGHVVPSLVAKFYDAIQKGEPVRVWGNGSAERDFLYVKDAARFGIQVMSGEHGAVNMGSGRVYSIRQIVHILSSITGHYSVEWDDGKPNGQDYRAYDLTRLDRMGFRPLYSVEAGIKETWDWYCNEQANKRRG
jgi:GDP-L-fucose synthase